MLWVKNTQHTGKFWGRPNAGAAWTVLTISSGAVVAAAPAPRAAATGRWTEEEKAAPAEATEAAEGKAAVLPPATAVGGDAERIGGAKGSKWTECSFPWTPGPDSSLLLLMKSAPTNHKLSPLEFSQVKITFMPCNNENTE